MTLRRGFLWCWLGGLAAFAVVILLSLPLAVPEVPGGIMDHQSAGSAAEVDRIQRAWEAASLWPQARLAMIGDLVFIGIYGIGAVLGGRWYLRSTRSVLRVLGGLALASGALFLATDYTETNSQLIQLLQRAGDDDLAALAATVRPVKMAAWVTSFVVLIAALLLERKNAPAG